MNVCLLTPLIFWRGIFVNLREMWEEKLVCFVGVTLVVTLSTLHVMDVPAVGPHQQPARLL